MTTLSIYGKTVLALSVFTMACGAYIYDNAQAHVDFIQLNEQQSPFQVQSVILGDNIGTAIVSNNGYLIEVAFDYETVDDSNGALGHSDVTIDITSLQINSVTNTATRQQYKDWTVREDHYQIMAQIRAYVDQNRLAQGV